MEVVVKFHVRETPHSSLGNKRKKVMARWWKAPAENRYTNTHTRSAEENRERLMRRKHRAFVRNEPVIVLMIFAILSLILGLSFGVASQWLWVWGVNYGAGLFVLGAGAFALYVRFANAQEERATRRKQNQS